MGHARPEGPYLSSINLILPYFYPNYFEDASDASIRVLSRTALENTRDLLRALEEVHQQTFGAALTIGHLSEVLRQPRLPDRGRCGKYDLTLAPSAYLEDDLELLERMTRKDGQYYEV